MASMILAVLLPVRNAEKTLVSSLASLREQTFSAFRVLAVDDASTDATPEILKDAVKDWASAGRPRPDGPSLEVVRLEHHHGIAAALIAGSHHLRDEEFVARHDADDLSLPQRFARQISYLQEHPEIGVLATDVETIFEDEGADGTPAIGAAGHARGVEEANDTSGSSDAAAVPDQSLDGWRRYEAWLASCHTPEEIARNLWIESPLPHPSVMMRRSALDAVGGYHRVSWPEDYDLWLRMLAAGIRLAKLPEVLVRWRDHPGRASRNQAPYLPENFLACRIHHLARYLRKRSGPAPVVVLWGAGRDGRRAGRALLAEGIGIECFLDIDPRKIGRTAYGRPIVSVEDWLRSHPAERPADDPSILKQVGVAEQGPVAPPSTQPLLLAAVGTAGARELIRARLDEAGYLEGTDYICLA
jgi:glycosyltransferase involved in cell wall biosynthesis